MEIWLYLAVFWVLSGIAGSVIGSNKGRSGDGFALGFFLGPLGLLIAVFMKPNTTRMEADALATGESRKCSFCAELVKAEAIICKHCGKELTPIAPKQTLKKSPEPPKITCWNCSSYQARGWDPSSGKCSHHKRKTNAWEMCDQHTPKPAQT